MTAVVEHEAPERDRRGRCRSGHTGQRDLAVGLGERVGEAGRQARERHDRGGGDRSHLTTNGGLKLDGRGEVGRGDRGRRQRGENDVDPVDRDRLRRTGEAREGDGITLHCLGILVEEGQVSEQVPRGGRLADQSLTCAATNVASLLRNSHEAPPARLPLKAASARS